MKKFYILLFLTIISIFANAQNGNDTKSEPAKQINSITDQTISKSVPIWTELKNRDYDLKEFGLLPNEKSTLFIKVFMAKIKYIKRHVNDEGFIAKNNIPLNPQTKKNDEKQLLANIKQETLQMLNFTSADIF
jgi:hypothetical protein